MRVQFRSLTASTTGREPHPGESVALWHRVSELIVPTRFALRSRHRCKPVNQLTDHDVGIQDRVGGEGIFGFSFWGRHWLGEGLKLARLNEWVVNSVVDSLVPGLRVGF